jgi:hypothetical protein
MGIFKLLATSIEKLICKWIISKLSVKSCFPSQSDVLHAVTDGSNRQQPHLSSRGLSNGVAGVGREGYKSIIEIIMSLM